MKMELSNIAKAIRDQLITSNRVIVFSWGANGWAMIDENTLQFKVQGNHFIGNVRIKYNIADDLYDIHFGHWKNNQWNNLETIYGVYCDQMVEVIDHRVEYIDQYRHR